MAKPKSFFITERIPRDVIILVGFLKAQFYDHISTSCHPILSWNTVFKHETLLFELVSSKATH